MSYLSKLKSLFRKGKLDGEMAGEMQEHLEQPARANRATGRPHAARGFPGLEHLFRDLRYAVRQLAKTPSFTGIAVFTLAVAIGANSTIFSMMNGFLLRPAVPENPDAYVGVYIASRDAARAFRPFSYAEFAVLQDANDVFADVAALSFSQVGLTEEAGLRRSFAFLVSDNYFALGGAKPAAGRFFDPAETRPNASRHVVIASHQLWQRHGGGPDFIGATIRINSQPYTVIGVTPEGFSGVSAILAPELWLPLGVFAEMVPAFGDARTTSDLTHPGNYSLNLFARLRPGFTIASAQGYLQPLAARLDAAAPTENRAPHELMLAKPFSVSPTPQNSSAFALLSTLTLCMSTVLMLIASLNLASMLLARGSARATEIAVRLALGSSRGGIVRQLLVEGFVLALAGGAAGTMLSSGTIAVIKQQLQSRFAGMGIVVTAHLQPDLRVLGFTLLGCVAATLVFSLGPALKCSRVNLVRDLKALPGMGGAAGTWGRLFSGANLLVTAQATLSLVLLFSAGLFLRAALQSTGQPTGLDPHAMIVGELDFALTPAPRSESIRRALAAAERLRSLPGVQAAGVSSLVPFANLNPGGRVAPVQGGTDSIPGETPRSSGGVLGAIAPGFLESLGARVIRGRDITESEARGFGRVDVCLVDARMAADLFPGADAIGQRVRLTDAPIGGEMEIVGIVSRHAQDVQDKKDPFPRIYVPLDFGYTPTLFLNVRCADTSPAAAAQLLGHLRQELRALDSDLPLIELRPFTAHLRDNFNLWQIRLGATVFGLFGLIALVFATIGIYGVKAYAVSRRTREIGIRMALGADRLGVFSLIMRQSLVQLGFALAAGTVLSLLVGRGLAAYLVDVHPADPAVLGVAITCLVLATVAGCFVPARRATQVEPFIALRAE